MVRHFRAGADDAQQNEFMAASLPLIAIDQHPIGWMTEQTWTEMEHTLRKHGVLTKPLDIATVYSLRFLHESQEAKP